VNKTVVMRPGQPSAGAPSPTSKPPQGFFSRVGGATRFMARAPVGPHPLMASMYWASADLFTLASQLSQGAVPQTAAQLRTDLDELFRSFNEKGAGMGLLPEDLIDARYALMALFDEILVQTNWPGRAEWQASPLQFRHFQENTAGENFFKRADTLCEQPHRAHVLQVYFLCLSLGFQGRYAMAPPAELEATQRRIAATVLAASIPAEVISPHAIPKDAGQTLMQSEGPIVRIGLACLAAAVVTYSLVLLVRSTQLRHALEPMRAYSAAPDRSWKP
jgi:type VI secretion system protein ImpK